MVQILKPSELLKGDVVCYNNASGRFPFGDMEVVKVNEGLTLRRPYITESGEAAYEELYWNKDSNFEFRLLDRGTADPRLANSSCTQIGNGEPE